MAERQATVRDVLLRVERLEQTVEEMDKRYGSGMTEIAELRAQVDELKCALYGRDGDAFAPGIINVVKSMDAKLNLIVEFKNKFYLVLAILALSGLTNLPTAIEAIKKTFLGN